MDRSSTPEKELSPEDIPDLNVKSYYGEHIPAVQDDFGVYSYSDSSTSPETFNGGVSNLSEDSLDNRLISSGLAEESEVPIIESTNVYNDSLCDVTNSSRFIDDIIGNLGPSVCRTSGGLSSGTEAELDRDDESTSFSCGESRCSCDGCMDSSKESCPSPLAMSDDSSFTSSCDSFDYPFLQTNTEYIDTKLTLSSQDTRFVIPKLVFKFPPFNSDNYTFNKEKDKWKLKRRVSIELGSSSMTAKELSSHRENSKLLLKEFPSDIIFPNVKLSVNNSLSAGPSTELPNESDKVPVCEQLAGNKSPSSSLLHESSGNIPLIGLLSPTGVPPVTTDDFSCDPNEFVEQINDLALSKSPTKNKKPDDASPYSANELSDALKKLESVQYSLENNTNDFASAPVKSCPDKPGKSASTSFDQRNDSKNNIDQINFPSTSRHNFDHNFRTSLSCSAKTPKTNNIRLSSVEPSSNIISVGENVITCKNPGPFSESYSIKNYDDNCSPKDSNPNSVEEYKNHTEDSQDEGLARQTPLVSPEPPANNCKENNLKSNNQMNQDILEVVNSLTRHVEEETKMCNDKPPSLDTREIESDVISDAALLYRLANSFDSFNCSKNPCSSDAISGSGSVPLDMPSLSPEPDVIPNNFDNKSIEPGPVVPPTLVPQTSLSDIGKSSNTFDIAKTCDLDSKIKFKDEKQRRKQNKERINHMLPKQEINKLLPKDPIATDDNRKNHISSTANADLSELKPEIKSALSKLYKHNDSVKVSRNGSIVKSEQTNLTIVENGNDDFVKITVTKKKLTMNSSESKKIEKKSQSVPKSFILGKVFPKNRVTKPDKQTSCDNSSVNGVDLKESEQISSGKNNDVKPLKEFESNVKPSSPLVECQSVMKVMDKNRIVVSMIGTKNINSTRTNVKTRADTPNINKTFLTDNPPLCKSPSVCNRNHKLIVFKKSLNMTEKSMKKYDYNHDTGNKKDTLPVTSDSKPGSDSINCGTDGSAKSSLNGMTLSSDGGASSGECKVLSQEIVSSKDRVMLSVTSANPVCKEQLSITNKVSTENSPIKIMGSPDKNINPVIKSKLIRQRTESVVAEADSTASDTSLLSGDQSGIIVNKGANFIIQDSALNKVNVSNEIHLKQSDSVHLLLKPRNLSREKNGSFTSMVITVATAEISCINDLNHPSLPSVPVKQMISSENQDQSKCYDDNKVNTKDRIQIDMEYTSTSSSHKNEILQDGDHPRRNSDIESNANEKSINDKEFDKKAKPNKIKPNSDLPTRSFGSNRSSKRCEDNAKADSKKIPRSRSKNSNYFNPSKSESDGSGFSMNQDQKDTDSVSSTSNGDLNNTKNNNKFSLNVCSEKSHKNIIGNQKDLNDNKNALMDNVSNLRKRSSSCGSNGKRGRRNSSENSKKGICEILCSIELDSIRSQIKTKSLSLSDTCVSSLCDKESRKANSDTQSKSIRNRVMSSLQMERNDSVEVSSSTSPGKDEKDDRLNDLVLPGVDVSLIRAESYEVKGTGESDSDIPKSTDDKSQSKTCNDKSDSISKSESGIDSSLSALLVSLEDSSSESMRSNDEVLSKTKFITNSEDVSSETLSKSDKCTKLSKSNNNNTLTNAILSKEKSESSNDLKTKINEDKLNIENRGKNSGFKSKNNLKKSKPGDVNSLKRIKSVKTSKFSKSKKPIAKGKLKEGFKSARLRVKDKIKGKICLDEPVNNDIVKEKSNSVFNNNKKGHSVKAPLLVFEDQPKKHPIEAPVIVNIECDSSKTDKKDKKPKDIHINDKRSSLRSSSCGELNNESSKSKELSKTSSRDKIKESVKVDKVINGSSKHAEATCKVMKNNSNDKSLVKSSAVILKKDKEVNAIHNTVNNRSRNRSKKKSKPSLPKGDVSQKVTSVKVSENIKEKSKPSNDSVTVKSLVSLVKGNKNSNQISTTEKSDKDILYNSNSPLSTPDNSKLGIKTKSSLEKSKNKNTVSDSDHLTKELSALKDGSKSELIDSLSSNCGKTLLRSTTKMHRDLNLEMSKTITHFTQIKTKGALKEFGLAGDNSKEPVKNSRTKISVVDGGHTVELAADSSKDTTSNEKTSTKRSKPASSKCQSLQSSEKASAPVKVDSTLSKKSKIDTTGDSTNKKATNITDVNKFVDLLKGKGKSEKLSSTNKFVDTLASNVGNDSINNALKERMSLRKHANSTETLKLLEAVKDDKLSQEKISAKQSIESKAGPTSKNLDIDIPDKPKCKVTSRKSSVSSIDCNELVSQQAVSIKDKNSDKSSNFNCRNDRKGCSASLSLSKSSSENMLARSFKPSLMEKNCKTISHNNRLRSKSSPPPNETKKVEKGNLKSPSKESKINFNSNSHESLKISGTDRKLRSSVCWGSNDSLLNSSAMGNDSNTSVILDKKCTDSVLDVGSSQNRSRRTKSFSESSGSSQKLNTLESSLQNSFSKSTSNLHKEDKIKTCSSIKIQECHNKTLDLCNKDKSNAAILVNIPSTPSDVSEIPLPKSPPLSRRTSLRLNKNDNEVPLTIEEIKIDVSEIPLPKSPPPSRRSLRSFVKGTPNQCDKELSFSSINVGSPTRERKIAYKNLVEDEFKSESIAPKDVHILKQPVKNDMSSVIKTSSKDPSTSKSISSANPKCSPKTSKDSLPIEGHACNNDVKKINKFDLSTSKGPEQDFDDSPPCERRSLRLQGKQLSFFSSLQAMMSQKVSISDQPLINTEKDSVQNKNNEDETSDKTSSNVAHQQKRQNKSSRVVCDENKVANESVSSNQVDTNPLKTDESFIKSDAKIMKNNKKNSLKELDNEICSNEFTAPTTEFQPKKGTSSNQYDENNLQASESTTNEHIRIPAVTTKSSDSNSNSVIKSKSTELHIKLSENVRRRSRRSHIKDTYFKERAENKSETTDDMKSDNERDEAESLQVSDPVQILLEHAESISSDTSNVESRIKDCLDVSALKLSEVTVKTVKPESSKAKKSKLYKNKIDKKEISESESVKNESLQKTTASESHFSCDSGSMDSVEYIENPKKEDVSIKGEAISVKLVDEVVHSSEISLIEKTNKIDASNNYIKVQEPITHQGKREKIKKKLKSNCILKSNSCKSFDKKSSRLSRNKKVYCQKNGSISSCSFHATGSQNINKPIGSSDKASPPSNFCTETTGKETSKSSDIADLNSVGLDQESSSCISIKDDERTDCQNKPNSEFSESDIEVTLSTSSPCCEENTKEVKKNIKPVDSLDKTTSSDIQDKNMLLEVKLNSHDATESLTAPTICDNDSLELKKISDKASVDLSSNDLISYDATKEIVAPDGASINIKKSDQAAAVNSCNISDSSFIELRNDTKETNLLKTVANKDNGSSSTYFASSSDVAVEQESLTTKSKDSFKPPDFSSNVSSTHVDMNSSVDIIASSPLYEAIIANTSDYALVSPASDSILASSDHVSAPLDDSFSSSTYRTAKESTNLSETPNESYNIPKDGSLNNLANISISVNSLSDDASRNQISSVLNSAGNSFNENPNPIDLGNCPELNGINTNNTLPGTDICNNFSTPISNIITPESEGITSEYHNNMVTFNNQSSFASVLQPISESDCLLRQTEMNSYDDPNIPKHQETTHEQSDSNDKSSNSFILGSTLLLLDSTEEEIIGTSYEPANVNEVSFVTQDSSYNDENGESVTVETNVAGSSNESQFSNFEDSSSALLPAVDSYHSTKTIQDLESIDTAVQPPFMVNGDNPVNSSHVGDVEIFEKVDGDKAKNSSDNFIVDMHSGDVVNSERDSITTTNHRIIIDSSDAASANSEYFLVTPINDTVKEDFNSAVMISADNPQVSILPNSGCDDVPTGKFVDDFPLSKENLASKTFTTLDGNAGPISDPTLGNNEIVSKLHSISNDDSNITDSSICITPSENIRSESYTYCNSISDVQVNSNINYNDIDLSCPSKTSNLVKNWVSEDKNISSNVSSDFDISKEDFFTYNNPGNSSTIVGNTVNSSDFSNLKGTTDNTHLMLVGTASPLCDLESNKIDPSLQLFESDKTISLVEKAIPQISCINKIETVLENNCVQLEGNNSSWDVPVIAKCSSPFTNSPSPDIKTTSQSLVLNHENIDTSVLTKSVCDGSSADSYEITSSDPNDLSVKSSLQEDVILSDKLNKCQNTTGDTDIDNGTIAVSTNVEKNSDFESGLLINDAENRVEKPLNELNCSEKMVSGEILVHHQTIDMKFLDTEDSSANRISCIGSESKDPSTSIQSTHNLVVDSVKSIDSGKDFQASTDQMINTTIDKSTESSSSNEINTDLDKNLKLPEDIDDNGIQAVSEKYSTDISVAHRATSDAVETASNEENVVSLNCSADTNNKNILFNIANNENQNKVYDIELFDDEVLIDESDIPSDLIVLDSVTDVPPKVNNLQTDTQSNIVISLNNNDKNSVLPSENSICLTNDEKAIDAVNYENNVDILVSHESSSTPAESSVLISNYESPVVILDDKNTSNDLENKSSSKPVNPIFSNDHNFPVMAVDNYLTSIHENGSTVQKENVVTSNDDKSATAESGINDLIDSNGRIPPIKALENKSSSIDTTCASSIIDNLTSLDNVTSCASVSISYDSMYDSKNPTGNGMSTDNNIDASAVSVVEDLISVIDEISAPVKANVSLSRSVPIVNNDSGDKKSCMATVGANTSECNFEISVSEKLPSSVSDNDMIDPVLESQDQLIPTINDLPDPLSTFNESKSEDSDEIVNTEEVSNTNLESENVSENNLNKDSVVLSEDVRKDSNTREVDDSILSCEENKIITPATVKSNLVEFNFESAITIVAEATPSISVDSKENSVLENEEKSKSYNSETTSESISTELSTCSSVDQSQLAKCELFVSNNENHSEDKSEFVKPCDSPIATEDSKDLKIEKAVEFNNLFDIKSENSKLIGAIEISSQHGDKSLEENCGSAEVTSCLQESIDVRLNSDNCSSDPSNGSDTMKDTDTDNNGVKMLELKSKITSNDLVVVESICQSVKPEKVMSNNLDYNPPLSIQDSICNSSPETYSSPSEVLPISPLTAYNSSDETDSNPSIKNVLSPIYKMSPSPLDSVLISSNNIFRIPSKTVIENHLDVTIVNPVENSIENFSGDILPKASHVNVDVVVVSPSGEAVSSPNETVINEPNTNLDYANSKDTSSLHPAFSPPSSKIYSITPAKTLRTVTAKRNISSRCSPQGTPISDHNVSTEEEILNELMSSVASAQEIEGSHSFTEGSESDNSPRPENSEFIHGRRRNVTHLQLSPNSLEAANYRKRKIRALRETDFVKKCKHYYNSENIIIHSSEDESIHEKESLNKRKALIREQSKNKIVPKKQMCDDNKIANPYSKIFYHKRKYNNKNDVKSEFSFKSLFSRKRTSYRDLRSNTNKVKSLTEKMNSDSVAPSITETGSDAKNVGEDDKSNTDGTDENNKIKLECKQSVDALPCLSEVPNSIEVPVGDKTGPPLTFANSDSANCTTTSDIIETTHPLSVDKPLQPPIRPLYKFSCNKIKRSLSCNIDLPKCHRNFRSRSESVDSFFKSFTSFNLQEFLESIKVSPNLRLLQNADLEEACPKKDEVAGIVDTTYLQPSLAEQPTLAADSTFVGSGTESSIVTPLKKLSVRLEKIDLSKFNINNLFGESETKETPPNDHGNNEDNNSAIHCPTSSVNSCLNPNPSLLIGGKGKGNGLKPVVRSKRKTCNFKKFLDSIYKTSRKGHKGMNSCIEDIQDHILGSNGDKESGSKSTIAISDYQSDDNTNSSELNNSQNHQRDSDQIKDSKPPSSSRPGSPLPKHVLGKQEISIKLDRLNMNNLRKVMQEESVTKINAPAYFLHLKNRDTIIYQNKRCSDHFVDIIDEGHRFKVFSNLDTMEVFYINRDEVNHRHLNIDSCRCPFAKRLNKSDETKHTRGWQLFKQQIFKEQEKRCVKSYIRERVPPHKKAPPNKNKVRLLSKSRGVNRHVHSRSRFPSFPKSQYSSNDRVETLERFWPTAEDKLPENAVIGKVRSMELPHQGNAPSYVCHQPISTTTDFSADVEPASPSVFPSDIYSANMSEPNEPIEFDIFSVKGMIKQRKGVQSMTGDYEGFNINTFCDDGGSINYRRDEHIVAKSLITDSECSQSNFFGSEYLRCPLFNYNDFVVKPRSEDVDKLSDTTQELLVSNYLQSQIRNCRQDQALLTEIEKRINIDRQEPGPSDKKKPKLDEPRITGDDRIFHSNVESNYNNSVPESTTSVITPAKVVEGLRVKDKSFLMAHDSHPLMVDDSPASSSKVSDTYAAVAVQPWVKRPPKKLSKRREMFLKEKLQNEELAKHRQLSLTKLMGVALNQHEPNVQVSIDVNVEVVHEMCGNFNRLLCLVQEGIALPAYRMPDKKTTQYSHKVLVPKKTPEERAQIAKSLSRVHQQHAIFTPIASSSSHKTDQVSNELAGDSDVDTEHAGSPDGFIAEMHKKWTECYPNDDEVYDPALVDIESPQTPTQTIERDLNDAAAHNPQNPSNPVDI